MDFNILLPLYAISSALLLWIAVTVVFIYAQKKNKWAIVDVFWSSGFVGVALLGWLIRGFEFNLPIIIVILITLWGLRLGLHLANRMFYIKEDPRYEALKANYSTFRSYLIVFVSQALFIWIMCVPLYFYFSLDTKIISSGFNIFFMILGSIICLVALIIETISDRQLVIYKEPGKLLRKGLWKYSRHPNYFGEIMFWFGLWVATRVFVPNNITFNIIMNTITLISPIMIYIIISKITGPMTEEKMTKYSDWQEYSENTPYIFPKLR
ncbi:MAG: DUF1295 domain-containing protein [Brevinema sp.]